MPITIEEKQRKQVSLNFQVFLADLPGLVACHKGRYAVYHDRRMAGIFNTFSEAVDHGIREYGARAFSVQEITDEIAHV